MSMIYLFNRQNSHLPRGKNLSVIATRFLESAQVPLKRIYASLTRMKSYSVFSARGVAMSIASSLPRVC